MYGEGPKTWIHMFSSIWTLHRYFAGGPRPEVGNKWPQQSRLNDAVGLDKTENECKRKLYKDDENGMCILIGSKWPRPLAETVSCPLHETTWANHGGKLVDCNGREISRQGHCSHALGPCPYINVCIYRRTYSIDWLLLRNTSKTKQLPGKGSRAPWQRCNCARPIEPRRRETSIWNI